MHNVIMYVKILKSGLMCKGNAHGLMYKGNLHYQIFSQKFVTIYIPTMHN